MLKTLRSRLWLSYAVVILVALFVVALALLAVGSQPDIRYFTTLQRLDAISRASRNELVRLQQNGAEVEELLAVLTETAVQNNTRILIANANNLQVIYDSSTNGDWLGDQIIAEEVPRNLLPSTDPNTVAGRFQHPDGTNWILYTRALSSSGFGRQIVIYAVPEPTPLAFFDELGIGNALLRAGLIALFVAALLGLWIARSVARPLQTLAAAAEAMTGGDYDQQIALQGPQEVRRVAATFNTMATEVNRTRNAQRDFVANVSHDLKTPVTSIRGWSQALLDGTAVSPDAQQHAASIIYSESERMERMVNELLDLARIESGQMTLHRESVDLAALADSLYLTLLPRAQEQQIYLTKAIQPVPPIPGDHDRLMQVFANLLDNALKHTPPQGTVQLIVRPVGADAVEFAVQDSGKGMPPEELQRIFERFYQVDKSRARGNGRTGSGLGLAIARELVTLHHGLLTAQSQVGQGSRFIVRLPIK